MLSLLLSPVLNKLTHRGRSSWPWPCRWVGLALVTRGRPSGRAVTAEFLQRPHAQNARGLVLPVLEAAGVFLGAGSARCV